MGFANSYSSAHVAQRAFASGLLFLGLGIGQATALELTRAVIIAPPNLSRPEQKAITMLAEEVEKRTRIKWEVAASWPNDGEAVIAVGPASKLSSFAGQYASEIP